MIPAKVLPLSYIGWNLAVVVGVRGVRVNSRSAVMVGVRMPMGHTRISQCVGVRRHQAHKNKHQGRKPEFA